MRKKLKPNYRVYLKLRFLFYRQNVTQVGQDANTVTCQTLNTGNVEINLANACDSYWTINTCPPFYISVQSSAALTAAGQVVCTGK